MILFFFLHQSREGGLDHEQHDSRKSQLINTEGKVVGWRHVGVNEFGGLNAASRGLDTEIFRTLSQSVNRAIGFAVAYKRSTRAVISNEAEKFYWAYLTPVS
jgi:hypothetical protein